MVFLEDAGPIAERSSGFTGTTIQFFVLQVSSGTYQPVDRIPMFPWFPADKLSEMLEARLGLGETQTLRQFQS